MHLKISSAKWRPFCPGGDELKNPVRSNRQYTCACLQKRPKRQQPTAPRSWFLLQKVLDLKCKFVQQVSVVEFTGSCHRVRPGLRHWHRRVRHRQPWINRPFHGLFAQPTKGWKHHRWKHQTFEWISSVYFHVVIAHIWNMSAFWVLIRAPNRQLNLW